MASKSRAASARGEPRTGPASHRGSRFSSQLVGAIVVPRLNYPTPCDPSPVAHWNCLRQRGDPGRVPERSRSGRRRPMDRNARALVRGIDHRRAADPDRARRGQVRSRSRRLRARADARRGDRRARRRAGELLRARAGDRPADGQLAGVRQRARGARHPRGEGAPAEPQPRARSRISSATSSSCTRTSIGEACFIDANGEEFARAVRGEIAQARRICRPMEEQTGLLRADLRAGLRAGAPDAPVRLAGHRRNGSSPTRR